MKAFSDKFLNLTKFFNLTNVVWLLFFDSHFISAVFARSAQRDPMAPLVFYFDSLPSRNKDYLAARQNVLNDVVGADLQSQVPGAVVKFSRRNGHEQGEGSNDCGVLALQHIFDFFKIKIDVSREWLRTFVS